MNAKALSLMISLVVLGALVFGLVVFAGTDGGEDPDDPRAHLPRHPDPTDHAAFFSEPFADGPSVTRACSTCHPGAAAEVMKTSHWTWTSAQVTNPEGSTRVPLGKRNALNNFCIAVPGNWARCTSCHVGYGWEDDAFLSTATPEQVDCLVCHDTTGLYRKSPAGAGRPADDVDLLAVARSVGRSTRTNCGVCHFKGGGGDGVKHGDLDETMHFPQARVDVHMGRHDLVCADCHRTTHHEIRGRYLPPQREEATRATCEDCHAGAPHREERLNTHSRAVACQTCHIPTYAVETGTKLWWDWSKAGIDGDPKQIAARLTARIQAGEEAARNYPEPIRAAFARVGEDPDLRVSYSKKKGLFLIARRQMPEYRWYDGTTRRMLPGEVVRGNGPVPINAPQGAADDVRSRIWPFKVHRGIQPIDAKHRHLLVPHTYGPGGYWTTFDWDEALRGGAEASGIAYSGRHEWIATEMYWPQNHMVQSKEKALRCGDCHGPGGRMDWKALGYPADPGRQGDRRQMGILRDRRSEGEAR